MKKRKFVIWAYTFDETMGGVIALHLLCKRLIELGHEAYIWEPGRPSLRPGARLSDYVAALRYEVGRTRRLYVNGFDNPVARRRDLAGAIVVYPEVVDGNPLGADWVVRWLLHRPGYHSGRVNYGPDDLFFFYQEAFRDERFAIDPENRLTVTWFNEAYRQFNHGERSGSAYLLRKGKGRPIVHDLEGSILVDDLSHAEKAEVFNRVRYLYCYDLYTMYALYAALCGCIPIVVPDPTLSKEAWTPDMRDRFGIAYGEQDIDWAVETRPRLIERLAAVRAEQDALVSRFAARCDAAFPE